MPSSSTPSTSQATTTTTTLSEQAVQDAFHSYLKSSLTQAKLERLLDADILSSAEGDLMITGPALCLYFAALRSTTNPPSVPLPRSSKSSSSSTGPTDLSYENCPPQFAPFLQVWASTVPHIQSFIPEQQHDLARIICDLPPISSPINPKLYGIAAELRAIALEISQRRSFQDRYASDLQAALDASEGTGAAGGARGDGEGKKKKKKASFVPPPVYDEVPPQQQPPPVPPRRPHQARPSSSTTTSTAATAEARSSWPTASGSTSASTGSRSGSGSGRSTRSPSPSPHWDKNRPLPPRPLDVHKKSTTLLSSPPPSRTSSSATDSSELPTILTPVSPAIEFIRETLYAALGDVLEDHPSLLHLLQTDPPRAYYASVSLAILFVSTQAIDHINQAVIGVLGTPLTLDQCPEQLKPLMRELMAIGREAKEVEEEDDAEAMKLVQRGLVPSGEARMDRVRKILVEGVGYEMRQSGERRSLEGRAVGFANRIGGLALKLTGLSAFRERQDMVFKILAGIAA